LTAVPYVTGSSPEAVALADYDGDGKLDLASANYGGNNITVYLGAGAGVFSGRVDIPVGSNFNPNWIATTDLNGDSKPDLATANYGTGTVSVFLNSGSGSFAAPVTYPALANTSGGLYDIVAADFNKDGKQDLAVANHSNGRTGIYLGNGDGTLQAP